MPLETEFICFATLNGVELHIKVCLSVQIFFRPRFCPNGYIGTAVMGNLNVVKLLYFLEFSKLKKMFKSNSKIQ